jgi:hypothetical protein
VQACNLILNFLWRNHRNCEWNRLKNTTMPYHYWRNWLRSCRIVSPGEWCMTFGDSVVFSASRIRHHWTCDPWRWDHYVAFKHYAAIIQWHVAYFRRMETQLHSCKNLKYHPPSPSPRPPKKYLLHANFWIWKWFDVLAIPPLWLDKTKNKDKETFGRRRMLKPLLLV